MTTDGASLARALAAEAFGVPPEAVPAGAAIGEVEAWDSLAHLRLILAVETQLGRELTTEEAAAIVSLADVERLLG